MFFAWENAHVDSLFGDYGVGGHGVDSVYLGQVYAADPNEFPTEIEVGLILSAIGAGWLLGGRRRGGFVLRMVLEPAHVGLHFQVQCAEFFMVCVVEFHGLLKGEEMVLAILASEGLNEVLSGAFARSMAMLD